MKRSLVNGYLDIGALRTQIPMAYVVHLWKGPSIVDRTRFLSQNCSLNLSRSSGVELKSFATPQCTFQDIAAQSSSILGAEDQFEYSVFILLMLLREFRIEIRSKRKRAADFYFQLWD